MLTLHLIRHAKSFRLIPNQRDFDRPLDPRGYSDASRIARELAAVAPAPVRLVSSPAKRAWQTAAIFAEAFNLQETDIQPQPLIYEASAGTLLALANALRDRDSCVLIIGHNPGISALAGLLSTSSVPEMTTCGIASLTFDGPRWQDLRPGDGTLLAYRYPEEDR